MATPSEMLNCLHLTVEEFAADQNKAADHLCKAAGYSVVVDRRFSVWFEIREPALYLLLGDMSTVQSMADAADLKPLYRLNEWVYVKGSDGLFCIIGHGSATEEVEEITNQIEYESIKKAIDSLACCIHILLSNKREDLANQN